MTGELFDRFIAAAEVEAAQEFALKIHDFNGGESAFVGGAKSMENADAIAAKVCHALYEGFD